LWTDTKYLLNNLWIKASLSQKPVGFRKGFGKNGSKPVFSSKSKVAFPKAEVLGKPQELHNFPKLVNGICIQYLRGQTSCTGVCPPLARVRHHR
jgi:hypothetical protein